MPQRSPEMEVSVKSEKRAGPRQGWHGSGCPEAPGVGVL